MLKVDSNWIVNSNQVQIPKGKPIGTGNFADVFKGTFTTEKTTHTAAIKVIRSMNNNSTEKEGMEVFLGEMNNEAMVMSLLSHRHIIGFFGICNEGVPMILMEFCVGGSLESHLVRVKETLYTSERVLYMREVAEGMRYLEKKNCIHRDLASRNVLVAASGLLKIADFGLSRIPSVTQVKDNNTHTQIPIRWMAPESLKRSPTYSSKSDVWSFGVLVFELFNLGVKPWPDANVKWIATKIRHFQMPTPPKRMPRIIRDLVNECWSPLPDSRPTFKQLSARITAIQEWRFLVPPAEKFSLNQIKGVARVNEPEIDDPEVLVIGPETLSGPSPPNEPSKTAMSTTATRKPSTKRRSTVKKSSVVRNGTSMQSPTSKEITLNITLETENISKNISIEDKTTDD
ncbi:hypothetical protein QR680_018724 [Steinernema hermaphroditum]|uniref:receptor protein-tyrosine kinase n=1 Tax=Steinernema hermaphroditum TaxID=289476 RepID=A0AA39LRG2_9BILA|nr:hypothetical protein QR680_018724 [Steinernema hermaphroditum]